MQVLLTSIMQVLLTSNKRMAAKSLLTITSKHNPGMAI